MKKLKILVRRGFALFMVLAISLSLMNLTAFAEGTEGANSSDSGYSSTGSEVSDKTDEAGKGDESNKSVKNDEADKSVKDDENDKSVKNDGTDKTNETGKPDKTDQADKSDETNKSGEADKTDEDDKSGEADKTDEDDKFGEADKTGEIDKSDEADKTEEIDKSDEADKTEEIDKSDEADKAEEIDKSDEADKTEEIDKSDEADKTEEIDKSDEVDKTDETDKLNGTDKFDDISGINNKLAVDENGNAVVTDRLIPVKILEEDESLPELVQYSDEVQAFLDAVDEIEKFLEEKSLADDEGKSEYEALIVAAEEAYEAVKKPRVQDEEVKDAFEWFTVLKECAVQVKAFFNAVDAVLKLETITKENAAQCVELVTAAQEAYAVLAEDAREYPGVQDALEQVNNVESSAKLLLSGEKISVANEEELKEAFTDNGNKNIVLGGSFTVSETINVTGEVTLDLKGQTLTWGNKANVNNSSLFRVEKGGVLTITDSSETAGYTKDYTVVNSVSNEDGTTEETTKECTATAMGGTITLQNQIMISDGENLSAIITVVGGMLVIEKGIVDGGEGRLARGVLIVDDGSVSMKGGAIIHCSARAYGNPYGSGIFVRDGSLNMSGGVIAENGTCGFYDIYRRGGGIGLRNGSLDISGGVITGNETGVGGGIGAEGGSGSITISDEAVIVGNSTIYAGGGGVNVEGSGYTVAIQDGALITKNIAKGEGGGVSTGGSTLLKVEGGAITGNEAHTGGGINTTNLFMTGGIVAGNTARGNTGGDTNGNGEGGGIRVGSGKGEITGGYITNNETRTTIDWGGGGLFISQGVIMKIQNLLVTGNTAQGLGGGVGGCSTGNVAISATDGLASFGNTAFGRKENGAHAAHKWQDQAALKNEDFLYYGSDDFFCAHSSFVSDAMLGGGSANWHGSQDTGKGYRGNSAENGEIDVQQLAIPKDGAAASQYLMGLSADPSEGDQGKAMKAAKVFITGNKSSTHGGGIMCNGVMFIGAIEKENTEFSSVPVEVKKVYQIADGRTIPQKDGEFTFALVKEDDFRVRFGRPIYDKAQTAVNDENGKVLFTINDLTEKGKYTYYLVEKPGSGPVIYDPAIYRVEVEVTTFQKISWEADTKFVVTVYSGKVTGITVMEIDENGNLAESESVDRAVFTNTYDPQAEKPVGSLRIIKSVSGGGAAAAEKTYVFTVTDSNGDSEEVSITGSGEKVLENLKPGLYHVTEADASIEGYKWEVNVIGNGDVTVPAGNAGAEITITNTYTVPDQPEPPTDQPEPPTDQPESPTDPSEPPADQPELPTDQPKNQAGSLRIVKSVSGGDTAAAEKAYVFTVTGPDGYRETVSITGSGETVLENLNPGLYQVTEEDASIEGYDWVVTGNGDVTVSENAGAEITITNTYTVRIPDSQPPQSGGGGSRSRGSRGTTESNPVAPQAEISDEQPPLNEISDEDVPLASAPETPIAALSPEDVPLAMLISDEDVPLAAVPKTGDNSWIWSLITLFSAAGLIGLELENRRKKNIEK